MIMSYVSKFNENEFLEFPGAVSYPIFTLESSPIANCSAAFNVFQSETYPTTMGVHDDNEGFYVIEGFGKMMVGDEEYKLEPHTAMYAPAGVLHGIKKDPSSMDLKTFLYHFPK